ncbi:hypothetical protein, partial [uncultured Paracoccus sp.]|uniref:hypothetical protein n=1 Tax=uncultured Paracoccus sp. TaxID=189685 RepID=UPI0025EE3EE6
GDALPKAWALARGVAEVGAGVAQLVGHVADAVGGWENLGRVGAAFIAVGLAGKVMLLAGSVLQLGVALMRVGSTGARGVGLLGRAFKGLKVAGAVAVAAIRAVGVAMIANPIGAAVAAIAGAAILIWQNWDWLKQRFPGVFRAIGDGWDWLMEKGRAVVDWFKDAPENIKAAWQSVVTFFDDMWNRVIEKFEWAKEKVAAVGDAIRDASNFITGANKGPISSGYDPVADAGNDVIPPPIPQSRAIGGGFSAGRPLRVGENGEELIFPDVGGWVAHNGKVRDMARTMRDAAGKAASALSDAVGHAPSPVAARAAPAGPINVTIVQQPGQSAEALLDALERRMARRAGRAMFDGVA